MSGESALDILARIWPEYDGKDGIEPQMMERVLRHVERELGTSLLAPSSWEQVRELASRVEGKVVKQDLCDLLTILQGASQPTVPSFETPSSNDDDEGHIPVRNISLSESPQYGPRHSRMSRGSSDEDSDSDSHGSKPPLSSTRYESPGARSRQSSHSSPTVGNSNEWRTNYNNMSIREQSRTEYEGFGAEIDNPPEFIEPTAQSEHLRRAREHARVLAERLDEQYQERVDNQQKSEALEREMTLMRRQIAEAEKNEQSRSAQIEKLNQHIEQSERSNSTQKSQAAAWKRQKDELEAENARLKESTMEIENAQQQLKLRLAIMEEDRRRINADQQAFQELNDRLLQEIASREAVEQQLELLNREKLQLAEELNGNMRDQILLRSASSSTFNDGTETQGRTLLSELASVEPGFEAGHEPIDERGQSSTRDSIGTGSLSRARQLQQEGSSSAGKQKQKRASLRDLNQRFREDGLDAVLGLSTQSSQYIPRPNRDRQDSQGNNSSSTVVVKDRQDDVDCALPPELQMLETKEALLNENLETQAKLIGTIETMFKIRETEHTGFGAEGIIRQNAALANVQKSERARRRKLQQSRVMSRSEVVNLLNPGHSYTFADGETEGGPSTKVVTTKDTKRMIANVTLVSMYTIVGYVLGLITSVFLVDNAQPGAFNYGRYLSYDADTGINDVDGGPNRFKVIDLLVYWIQNLVWQADANYVPT
ncbi:hypothetical protein BGZ99_005159 [Dissophora globulifera]|uniref:Uncharacterized protein n=1 Tax=Dissophora globulifera TaxID=979702 RepID=A0A9P6UTQ5_9FUNG|nr:hypothetical protein BGZ99_005159 [Dissophora globulifera]